MSTPDANGWIKGMDEAPKDDLILVAIPTDDPDEVEVEIASWDDVTGRWDISGAPDREPTHWKPINVPVEYEEAEEAA